MKRYLKQNKIKIINFEISNITINNFLKKVRSICNKKKIIIIFDECTTGYRENMGGIHLKFKVNPDIALFGKALGNGYAITAIIGKKKVMKFAQSSFISSTFWNERIGYAAALAALREMKKKKILEYN